MFMFTWDFSPHSSNFVLWGDKEYHIIVHLCSLRRSHRTAFFAISIDNITAPFNIWYQDDVTSREPVNIVLHNLQTVVSELSKIRLVMNSFKSEIINIHYDTNDFANAIRNMKLIVDSGQVTSNEDIYILGSSLLPSAIQSNVENKLNWKYFWANCN